MKMPVGERKSGMPAEVLIPAPVMKVMEVVEGDLRRVIKEVYLSVIGGRSAVGSSFPIEV